MIKRILFVLAVLFPSATLAQGTSPPAIVYPPGQYFITTPTHTIITWTETSVTFSWQPVVVPPTPPAPGPGPVPPAPAPPPGPPQIVGTIHLILIADKGNPMLLSNTLVADLNELDKDLVFHRLTTDDPTAKGWMLEPDVKAVGVPALLFVTINAASNSVLVYSERCPSTEPGVLEQAKQARIAKRSK